MSSNQRPFRTVQAARDKAAHAVPGLSSLHDGVEQMPAHDAHTESVIDEIDRMRGDGGVAPEIEHTRADDAPLPNHLR
ncbi:hypothetical protein GCM10010885_13240 [Alicyclobacillus cellulosilyticus]|uniref:Uncharacterized protein n=1 Tax=Alicyclobacillus cellulosilyticus TaxID=1003997 RepID=A0A917KC07_9BACL|nr:hypothetical protein [Alicyclobacillus cellulosilyticus]GGJ05470.1 hypothetical protein GCM10010885_13240 [Alicyclobacillus cellulosilyticus]